MEIAALVLEFLRVLLSPAAVAGIGLLVVVYVFKDDIKGLLRRIATIRFRGAEFLVPQKAREDSVEDPDAVPQAVEADEEDIPSGITLSSDDQKKIVDLIRAERARAAIWEYRFLGYFLAPTTQKVLDWFAGLPQPTTVQMFDAYWSGIVPSPEERAAIISALTNHHLVQASGGLLTITSKGQEYLQFRGPFQGERHD